MEKVVIGTATLYRGDSLAAMREMPDNAFSLAIVDPPYGLGGRLHKGGRDKLAGRISASQYTGQDWDKVPTDNYFSELKRVSRNQIIWGGNYSNLPPCRGFLIWDKNQPMPTMSFGEFAWTSFDGPAKKISYTYTNYVEGKTSVSEKIHPTQKPVGLYKHILLKYAKPGDTILDTHHGSGSNAIACLDMGYPITAYEIDADYFKAACERIERSQLQGKLF